MVDGARGEYMRDRPVDAIRRPDPGRPFAHYIAVLSSTLEELSRDLRVPSDGQVLDYGCADAPYHRWFGQGVTVIGADLPGNASASLVLRPDGTVPTPDASFDAVLSTQVLEHVPEPELYLAECNRVLRPGGRMLLSTHGVFYHHPDPVDYWRWTCDGLERLVSMAGLDVVRFEGIFGMGATGMQLLVDAVAPKLPRRIQGPVFRATHPVIRSLDRHQGAESKRRNASVFALIAEKTRMTGGSDEFHVACAVVGSYLPHAAAMVASLVEQGGEPALTLHLLHDGGLPRDDRRAFEAMLDADGVELRTYEIPDERLEGVPTAGFTGKGSWYRIFLPELIPDVGRLLYLDVDLLVLDAVTPLREVDLSNAYLGAVTNVFEPEHLGRAVELGLSGPEAYFNAGVLLFNVDAMRRDDCTAALLRYARANADRLHWRDQDALNVVLGEGRVHLSPRWNCMNSIVEFAHSAEVFSEEEVVEARTNPAIRHFEGPALNKPWHYLADPAMQRLYRYHRQSTPWPEVVLDGRTRAARLLRPLPGVLRRRAYVRLARWRASRNVAAS